jgi:hypothetical protein
MRGIAASRAYADCLTPCRITKIRMYLKIILFDASAVELDISMSNQRKGRKIMVENTYGTSSYRLIAMSNGQLTQVYSKIPQVLA